MHNYRSGDEVNIELRALVTRVTGDVVRVRFGDTEYDADPSSLEMVTRSIHAGDEVKHGDRNGAIAQMLEENVFLVRYDGATGADAYGVVARGELAHADNPVSAAPSPAPAPAPASEAQSTHREPLELTTPAPAPATAPAPTRTGGSIDDMAASLASVTGRQVRRQPLDLESIGTTETLPGVHGEMTLGDDMRLGNSTES